MNRAYLFYVMRFISRSGTGRGGRRIRSAILAVALSLVPLVAVVEVSGGMVEGITSRFLEIGSFHLQVIFLADFTSSEIEHVVDRISAFDFVERAFRMSVGIGLAYAGNERYGVSIRGYEDRLIESDPGFVRYLSIEGEPPEGDAIALSAGVSAEMGVGIGDSVGLIVARTLPSGRFLLKQHRAVVSAVYSTGYADLDGQSVIVPFDTAVSLFPDAGARRIGIKISDPFGGIDAALSAIQTILPIGAYVYSWRELERGMYATFRTTRSLLIIVMAVIVCVAGITISSSLFILVAERETEIALLRSVGATSRGMRHAFLLLGFFAGAIGAFLGVSGGLLVSLRINELFTVIERVVSLLSAGIGGPQVRILNPAYYLERIPVEPDFGELLVIVAASVALATLSAWLPAGRAGAIVPARSLHRH